MYCVDYFEFILKDYLALTKEWKQSRDKTDLLSFLVILLIAAFLVVAAVLQQAILTLTAYGMLIGFGIFLLCYSRNKCKRFYRKKGNKEAYVEENIKPVVELLKKRQLFSDNGIDFLVQAGRRKLKRTPFSNLMRQIVIILPLTVVLLAPFYTTSAAGMIGWLIEYFAIPQVDYPKLYLGLFFIVILLVLGLIGLVTLLYPFIKLAVFSREETLGQLCRDLEFIKGKNGQF